MVGMRRVGIAFMALVVLGFAAAVTTASADGESAGEGALENGAWPSVDPRGEPLENGAWPAAEPPAEDDDAFAREAEAGACEHHRAARSGAALGCYVEAADTTRLLDPDALRLCEFAPSRGPIECFRRADTDTLLLDSQMVDLCRCAYDTRPVDCVLDAQRETRLNDAQIIDLCRATHLEGLYFDCRPIWGPPPPDPYGPPMR